MKSWQVASLVPIGFAAAYLAGQQTAEDKPGMPPPPADTVAAGRIQDDLKAMHAAIASGRTGPLSPGDAMLRILKANMVAKPVEGIGQMLPESREARRPDTAKVGTCTMNARDDLATAPVVVTNRSARSRWYYVRLAAVDSRGRKVGTLTAANANRVGRGQSVTLTAWGLPPSGKVTCRMESLWIWQGDDSDQFVGKTKG